MSGSSGKASVRDRAVVLRTTAYGESDRIVTLYLREHGQIKALARGARKSHKRFAAGLPPYVCGDALVQRRAASELGLLDEFTLSAAGSLPTDLACVAHAGYACELVETLTPLEVGEPMIFDLLLTTLREISDGGADALRLRRFELQLLEYLGFAPSSDACVQCSKMITADEDTAFERRGLVCADCCIADGRRDRAPFVSILAALRAGELPDAARALPVAGALRRLLACWLADPLGGRNLRSLEFIDKLNRGLA